MPIDVAFSVNRSLAVPLMVTINSIIKNAQQPNDLRFNVVIPPGAASDFQPQLKVAFPDRHQQIRLIEYLPPQYLRDYLDARFKPDSETR